MAVPGTGDPSVLVRNTPGVKLSVTNEGLMNPSQIWGYFQLTSGELQPGFHPCLVFRISRRAEALAAVAGEAGVGAAAPGVPSNQTARRPSAGGNPGNAGASSFTLYAEGRAVIHPLQSPAN